MNAPLLGTASFRRPSHRSASDVALVALAVAGGVALAPLAARPMVLGVAAAGVVLAAGAWAIARRCGASGLWMIALVASVLAGEMSSLAFGGQNGRLLWADAVLGAGLVVVLLRGRLRVDVPRVPHLDAAALLIAWAGLTLVLSRDVLTGIAELKEWIVAWLAGAAAVAFARDRARARLLLGAVAVTGSLIAVLMLKVALDAPLGPVLAILMKQVDLPWGRTNYLAGILILAIAIAVGLLGDSRSWRARALWVGVLALNAMGVALSASKGAIVALLVGLLVAFAGGGRASRLTGAILLAVIGAAVALFVAGPLHQVLAYRMQASALDYSMSQRLDLYRLAFDQFLHHPLLGIGINNFSVVANRLTGVDTVPHNFELGYLTELGLPGLVLALGWVAALGVATWQVRRAARTSGERTLALGLWAAFIGFVVHNQFESTIYGEQYKIVWMVTAAAITRLGVRGPEGEPLR